jgi:hypothetical protein
MSETSNTIALRPVESTATPRRVLLGQSMPASACFVAGAIQHSAKSSVAAIASDEIRRPETPEQALQILHAGNQRFAQEKSMDTESTWTHEEFNG